MYAYGEGVGSARAIEELCEWEPAYQWLTGAVVVNAHTLSDFRVKHEQALKELFVQVLGLLSADGLITLERVMQDGTKIPAYAAAVLEERNGWSKRSGKPGNKWRRCEP